MLVGHGCHLIYLYEYNMVLGPPKYYIPIANRFTVINLFLASIPILFSLKTLKNLWFVGFHFCSGSSQILILKLHILRASLPPSLFLPNFTLANRNPSLTQHSSWFPSVSLFSLNPFDHMRSQVLDIPNYMPSQANQIYYQAIYTS